MQPGWLLAALVTIAVDAATAQRAWVASAGERAALWAAIACVVGAATAGAAAWVRACRWGAGRAWPTLAAAPALIGIGAALGVTHTGRAWGPFAVAAALAGGGAALAWTAARAPRAPALALGVATLIVTAALPARLYAPLRALAALAAFALLAGAGRRVAPSLPRGRLAALAALLVIAATLALRSSANVRFVAATAPPTTALLLDGAAALAPERRARGAAVRAPDRAPATSMATPLGSAHVVVVTVDALRADALGCYGAARATPTFDALAARGIRFTRAYAQAPHTAWSLASLWTGRAPDALGGPTLADALTAQRWRTEAFYPAGLFFDGRAALSRYATSRFGFAWADTRTLDAPALTDAVLARLAALRADGEPRALFWVHYFDPHEPYLAHAGLTRGDDPAARYAGEVALVDRELARLVDGLRALARPTILVIAADHGEEFGEHGGAYHGSSLYEEQVRVPLIVVAPGWSPRVVDAPVDLLDVLPGLRALAELPDLVALDGADPLGAAPRGDAHAQLGTRRMLVRGRWKLIHELRRDLDELYDLDADPREQRNRADAEPAVRAALQAALAQWFNLSPPGALERTLTDGAQPALRRAAAAHELGRLESYAAGPALRAALDDDDAAVVAEAALALGELSDPSATPALTSLLTRAPYRNRAAVMLGRLRQPVAAAPLVEALDDANGELRRLAAHYLGFVGAAAAVEPLIDAASDPRLRGDAYVALGRIAGRIGSRRAARYLAERLAREPYDDARAELGRALWLALGGGPSLDRVRPR
jgi:HEAT repeat protein